MDLLGDETEEPARTHLAESRSQRFQHIHCGNLRTTFFFFFFLILTVCVASLEQKMAPVININPSPPLCESDICCTSIHPPHFSALGLSPHTLVQTWSLDHQPVMQLWANGEVIDKINNNNQLTINSLEYQYLTRL